jgi:hypothetical protein
MSSAVHVSGFDGNGVERRQLGSCCGLFMLLQWLIVPSQRE